MKKLIAITVLVLISMFITSFSRYDSHLSYTKEDIKFYDSLKNEGYIMLPGVFVTYDTIRCKYVSSIKDRPEMRRMEKPMMMGQRGRMNPVMSRGKMNQHPVRIQDDSTNFKRPMMMGRSRMEFSSRGRMMNPRMEQMMREHKQFKGDTTKFKRPMRMNHR